jgi:hypothetical protein
LRLGFHLLFILSQFLTLLTYGPIDTDEDVVVIPVPQRSVDIAGSNPFSEFDFFGVLG